MPDKRLVVIAGTYHQFVEYCRERHLNPRHATYGGRAHSLRGLGPEGAEVVITGTYNADVDRDYLAMLQARGMAVRHEPTYLPRVEVAHAY